MVADMEMPLCCPLEFVATDPGRGIARRWSVSADRDLFGLIVVETRWGRIGAPGRRLSRSFTTRDAAARYIGALLLRRRSAPRRIGVAYRMRAAGEG